MEGPITSSLLSRSGKLICISKNKLQKVDAQIKKLLENIIDKDDNKNSTLPVKNHTSGKIKIQSAGQI